MTTYARPIFQYRPGAGPLANYIEWTKCMRRTLAKSLGKHQRELAQLNGIIVCAEKSHELDIIFSICAFRRRDVQRIVGLAESFGVSPSELLTALAQRPLLRKDIRRAKEERAKHG